MPKASITRFSGVAIDPVSSNNNNGLYPPQLTTAQRDAIPIDVLKDGGVIYNIDVGELQTYNNGWQDMVGTGNVTGPGVSVTDNIATFADTTGNVIKDSGVLATKIVIGSGASTKGNIVIFDNTTGTLLADSGILAAKVAPPAMLNGLNFGVNDTINEISNLGQIRFDNTDEIGLIFVGGLSPVNFQTNDLGEESQVCSVFTGGVPADASSPSALIELQTHTGAFLLSRLTSAEEAALVSPQDGMIVYNTDTKRTEFLENGSWFSPYPNIIDNGLNSLYIGPRTVGEATEGFGCIAVGTAALNNDTGGSFNTAFGYESLANNAQGVNNSAQGAFTLTANVGSFDDTWEINLGSYNTAMGTYALSSNTLGIYNTSIGYLSSELNIGSFDVDTGISTGSFNTAGGSQSLSKNLYGNNNVSLGYLSASAQSNYENCVFIGATADASANSLTNAIAIGYNATVATSNSMVLGNGCNVGIGTSSPAVAFHAVGGQIISRRATTTNTTVLRTDYIIGVTSTASARTITLPAASSTYEGQVYIVKDESGVCSVNNITVNVTGGGTIDASTTAVINQNYGSLSFYASGSQWFIF